MGPKTGIDVSETRKKSLALVVIRIPDHPVRSLVAIPTELSEPHNHLQKSSQKKEDSVGTWFRITETTPPVLFYVQLCCSSLICCSMLNCVVLCLTVLFYV